MPGISTTPNQLYKSIVIYLIKSALPPGIPTGIITDLSDSIINLLGKCGVDPKKLFEMLSDENKDFVSKYAIYLKKLVHNLKSGVPITDSCKIIFMNEGTAKAWLEFFDNFKVKTD